MVPGFQSREPGLSGFKFIEDLSTTSEISKMGGRLKLCISQKVLLRHASLSSTQRYLGRISDVEAIRWMDNLHG